MTSVSSSLAANVKSGREQLFSPQVRSVRLLDAVMRKLHDIYPSETAQTIARLVGVKKRTAQYWFSRERDMNVEAFIALICSDDGDKILQTLMEALPSKERPRWWRRHANAAEMARIETLQAEQEKRLRQLRLDMGQ